MNNRSLKIKNVKLCKISTSLNYKNVFALFLMLFSFCFMQGQSLTAYKQEALKNNPEIKVVEHTQEVNEEKIQEAGSLPNTTIATGYFVSEPETRTGAQKARFSARQQLPWFGTVKSKKETAIANNEVDKNKIEITRRKITYQVEQYYYKLYALNAKQKQLTLQDSLLKNYMEMALIAVENNNASAVDVLKLNIAMNNLFDQQEIMKGEILTAESEMNQLLHRDGFDTLLIPNNLFIPEEEPTMMLDDITYHPELLTYDYMQEVIIKKERVNTKESLPSIGLGLDYTIVQERPDISFSENGKDIIMPVVSFSIPLFSKKHASRTKQYDIQKEVIIQERDATQNKLENYMEKAINNRITARINYNTQQKNILQANQVTKILLVQYQTAQIDFQELLDVQQMILNFELKKIEAISTYFINTATLNYLR